MKTRVLGKDLTVSAVSFGCMGMTHAYGAPSDPTEMTKQLLESGNTVIGTVRNTNKV